MIGDEPEVTPDAESCGIANDFAMRKLVAYDSCVQFPSHRPQFPG
jgi:hypothetical protein